VFIYRSELYDVFVNGTTGQISIAPHAKGNRTFYLLLIWCN